MVPPATHLKMAYVIEALEELLARYREEKLRCLEIGTIRSYEEGHESTKHIGQTLGSQGTLWSVDNSKKSIAIARVICQGRTNIIWFHRDSIEFLKECVLKGEQFHFIFLDGVNDAYHTDQEFNLALQLIVAGGIIMVDDAGVGMDGHIPDKTHLSARKGIDIYHHLPGLGLDFRLLQTIQGAQLKIINRKPTTGKTVSIAAHRRPGYLHQVLAGLARCTGVEDYKILLSVDGGYPDKQKEIRQVVEDMDLPIETVYHHQNLGCSGNTFYVLNWAFANPAIDQIIHLEDDTVPAEDFLVFLQACLERYRDDPAVFTISGYRRRFWEASNFQIDRGIGHGDEQLTVKRPWFTPWGWGLWRHIWNEVRDGWFGITWDRRKILHWRIRHPKKRREEVEGENLLKLVRITSKGTWDIPMNKYWRWGRYEIAPDVSRIQNIGADEGMWNPGGDWHYQNQYSPIWMGDGQHSVPSEYIFIATNEEI